MDLCRLRVRSFEFRAGGLRREAVVRWMGRTVFRFVIGGAADSSRLMGLHLGI